MCLHFRSRSSLVGVVTSYWLDVRGIGVRFLKEARDFSLCQRPRLPCIQWALGVKRPWPEADHSLNPVLMLTSQWSCVNIPPHAFVAYVGEVTDWMLTQTSKNEYECWAEGRGPPGSCHLHRRSSQLQVICEHSVYYVMNLFLFCSSVYERCYKYRSFLKVGISSNDIW